MSTYDTGLDILGAAGVAREALSKAKKDAKRSTGAAKRAEAAANRISARGARIARKHRVGNTLMKVAARLSKKAARAKAMATRVTTPAQVAAQKQAAKTSLITAVRPTTTLRPEARAAVQAARAVVPTRPVARVAPATVARTVIPTRPVSRATSPALQAARTMSALRTTGASTMFRGQEDEEVTDDEAAAAEAIDSLSLVLEKMADLVYALSPAMLEVKSQLVVPGGEVYEEEAEEGAVVADAPTGVRRPRPRPARPGISPLIQTPGKYRTPAPSSDDDMLGEILGEDLALAAEGRALISKIDDQLNTNYNAPASVWLRLRAAGERWASRAEMALGQMQQQTTTTTTTEEPPPFSDQEQYGPPGGGGGAGAGGGDEGGEGEAAPSPFDDEPYPEMEVPPTPEGPFIEDEGVFLDEGTPGYEEYFDESAFITDEGAPAYEEYADYADEYPALDADLVSEYEEGFDPFSEAGELAEDASLLSEAEGMVSEAADEAEASEAEAAPETTEPEPFTIFGLDFKWHYIFAPWMAAQDWEAERSKAPEPTGGIVPKEVPPEKRKVVPPSPEAQAKLAAAQKRLAKSQAKRTPTTGVSTLPQYEPRQSETLAERLAYTKSFLEADAAALAASAPTGETVEGDDESGGLLSEDTSDINIEDWQTDITDTPADPTRRTASLHHGAGYLEEMDYPRYGASAGQEGGIMFPRETVHVYGDEGDNYDRGADVLGGGAPPTAPKNLASQRAQMAKTQLQQATKPRLQFMQKTSPSGGKFTAVVPRKTKGKQSRKKTLANARDVAKHAISVGKRLVSAVKKGKVKTPRPATKAPTKVRGAYRAEEMVYGAPAPRRKPVATMGRGRLRLSPAQLQKVGTASVKAGEELKKYAAKYEKQVKAVEKKESAAASAAKRALSRRRGTRIRGEEDYYVDEHDADVMVFGDDYFVDADDADVMVFGAEAEVLTDELVNDAMVDTAFDEAEAEVDPTFDVVEFEEEDVFGQTVTYTTTPGTGPGVGAPTGGAENPYGAADPYGEYPTETTYDPSATLAALQDPNAGQGPMPTVETLPERPHIKDPGPGSKWHGAELPEGAVPFVPEGVLPNRVFGSRNFFQGNKNGFYWQEGGPQVAHGGHWNGAWGSWVGVLTDWGKHSAANYEITNESNLAKKWLQANGAWPPSLDMNAGVLSKASEAAGWGPLVANPTLDKYKNLRLNTETGQWFWYWDKAPAEAKEPYLQEELAKAIVEWKTAVATERANLAAQAIQDQIDADEARAQAKQIAAEDAALARQQEVEQKQADHDASIQAKADEAAARQQAIADEAAAKQMERDIMVEKALAEEERARAQQEFEQSEAAWRTAAELAATAETPEEAEAAVEALVPSFPSEESWLPGFEEGEMPPGYAEEGYADTGEFTQEPDEGSFEEGAF